MPRRVNNRKEESIDKDIQATVPGIRGVTVS